MMKIPNEVRMAASGMLAPFGVDLDELLRHDSRAEKTNIDPRKYVDIATVNYEFGLKRWTIARLIKRGKIKACKMAAARSGKVLIEKKSLMAYLKTKEL